MILAKAVIIRKYAHKAWFDCHRFNHKISLCHPDPSFSYFAWRDRFSHKEHTSWCDLWFKLIRMVVSRYINKYRLSIHICIHYKTKSQTYNSSVAGTGIFGYCYFYHLHLHRHDLILAGYIKQVLVAHKNGFLLPVHSQRREMVENENLFDVSSE